MYPVLLSIGEKISVYTYGTCIAVGLILAIFLAGKMGKKYGIDPDLFFSGGLYTFIFGIIGAKILYIITDLKAIIADPSILLDVGSGFVIYGGLIAGAAAFIIYVTKVKKLSFMDKADIAVPFVAMAQGFGRIGCFAAGCCYGKPAPEGAWYAVVFPDNNCCAPSGVELIPVQIISAILLFGLFALLLAVIRREKFAGIGLSAYVALYSLGRFLIEFIRDDPRGSIGALSTSQFIAIFAFIAGVGSYFLFRWYAEKPLKLGGYPEDEAAEEDGAEEESEAAEASEETEAAEEASEETEAAESGENSPEEAPGERPEEEKSEEKTTDISEEEPSEQ